MMVKGLEFSLIRYGYIHNDLAWNVAMPHPASRSNPAPAAEFCRFPCSVVLIKHPDAGYLLYDVGEYPPEDSPERSSYWDEYFPMEVKREDYIDRHLQRGGLEIGDISVILLSHMHCDHANGIKFFSGTRAGQNVYVPKLDFMQACAVALSNDDERNTQSPYWRSIVTTPGLQYHLVEEDTQLFPGVHLILLGGHTPAVMGLLLELEGGNYLFPNDACGSALNYGPPARSPGIVYDSLAYGSCINKLRRLQAEYDAKIIFSHDRAADEGYLHFPEFYR